MAVSFRNPIAAARRDLERDQPEEALKRLEAALRKDPANPEARALLERAADTITRRRVARAEAAVREANDTYDLNIRVALLEEAAGLLPHDPRMQLLLLRARNQRQAIGFMRMRAQFLHEAGNLPEAEREKGRLRLVAPGYDENLADAIPPVVTTDGGPEKPRDRVATGTVQPTAWSRRRVPLLLGSAIVIAIAVGFALLPRNGSAGGSVAQGAVAIEVEPSDATIDIDGRAYAGEPLAAGSHRLRVTRAGFRSFEREIRIPASSPVTVALEPLPTTLAIDSQPPQAEYSLDSGPPVPITDGQVTVAGIVPGTHALRVFAETGGKGETLVEFEVGVARSPRIVRIQPAEKTVAVAVGQFADERVLGSSPVGLAVRTPEGEEIGRTAEEPFRREGDSRLEYVVQSSQSEYPIFLNTAAETPVLNVFVRTYVPTGVLLVQVDQDEVTLTLNGRPYGRSALRKGTENAFRGLPAGRYSVSVEREGFRAEPPNARVAIAEGRDTRVDFRLVPLATVEIRDALPGARVFINGSDRGVVNAGGTASIHTDAGPCRIELRAQRRYHRPIERQCSGTTVVAGADASMVETGFIHIPAVRPANAKIVATRPGEPQRAVSAPYTELPVGTYVIRATAPGYQEFVKENVAVIAGRANEVGALELSPEQ